MKTMRERTANSMKQIPRDTVKAVARDRNAARHTMEPAPSVVLAKGAASAAESESIRILVAARTLISTELFCSVLSRDPRFAVYPYPDVQPQRGPAFDVALISAVLEEEAADGIDLARRLQTNSRVTKTVILLDQPTRTTVLQAFRSGARGVFCSRQSLESLSECLWSVHNGRVWASNEHLEYLLEALGEPVPVRLRDAKGGVLLSKREEDVVSLVLEGLTNREIADRLGLSEHTIKNYLFRVFDKLGISNRSELILYALSQNGDAPPTPAELQALALRRSGEVLDENSTLDCSRVAAELLCGVQGKLGEGRGGRSALSETVSTYTWLLVAKAVGEAAHDVLRARLTSEQVAESRRKAAEWLKSRTQHKLPPADADSATLRVA